MSSIDNLWLVTYNNHRLQMRGDRNSNVTICVEAKSKKELITSLSTSKEIRECCTGEKGEFFYCYSVPRSRGCTEVGCGLHTNGDMCDKEIHPKLSKDVTDKQWYTLVKNIVKSKGNICINARKLEIHTLSKV